MTTPTLDEQIDFLVKRAGRLQELRQGLAPGVPSPEQINLTHILESLRELKAIKESAQEEAGHEIGLWPLSAISAVAKLKAELAALEGK